MRIEKLFAGIMLSICLMTAVPSASMAAADVQQNPEIPSAQNSDAPGGLAVHALQGGIEHDEKLPAMGKDYAVGKSYPSAGLTALSPENEWFKVPQWLTGSWHSESQEVLSLRDYPSGTKAKTPYAMKEVSDVDMGSQRDTSGQVWKFVKIGYVQKAIVSQGIGYSTLQREEILESDSSRLVLKIQYDQVVVDEDQTIQVVSQIQSINTYTRLDEGLVRMHASMKSFDADGNPKILQVGEKILKKTAPFKISDQDGDLDLKKLFGEYLNRIGKPDLIPAGS